MVTSPRRAPSISERQDVALQLVIDREGVDARDSCPSWRSMCPHSPRAVADRVALVSGGYPLVDDHDVGDRGFSHRRLHREGQRLVERRPIEPQFLELLGTRRTAARSRTRPVANHVAARRACRSTKPKQRAVEILRLQPLDGLRLSLEHGVLQLRDRQDGVHQRRHVHRILVVVKNAAAIHGRRHGRRRIGQDRHLLVERFDERHAEALVLAGAQEQIGDVVVRDELLVGDMAGEVHVRQLELLDQVIERGRDSVRTG